MNHRKNDDVCLCAVLALAAVANASGLFNTILEPDSALYAAIAKTMVQRHDFVDLFSAGSDWLDKPHLPFWLSATSFSVFGVSTWAYKLPALILVLVAAFYTYAFARLFYSRRIALGAALIFLSAEHIIVSSGDVRAEAYLTAFIFGSVYHFCRADSSGSRAHLVVGSLLAGAAVMTKGIFALIPIGGALGGGLLLTAQWARAFHVRWLAAVVLVLLFVSPEMYCLWQQFDLHPEKVVFGTTGVSGLRFFFWDSQFGRFFNTGPIRGAGSPLQYFVVMPWAFLPWSPALYGAAYGGIRNLVRRRTPAAEYFALSGGLVTFVLFSASQFQLPHYLNIAFPFFAIMTSSFILGLEAPAAERLLNVWLGLFAGAALVICVALQVAFRPGDWAVPAVLLAIATPSLLYLQRRRWKCWQSRAIAILATASAFGNLFLNVSVVPALMRYQSGSEMAAYLNTNYAGRPVFQLRNSYSWDLEFYLRAPVTAVDASMVQNDQLPPGALIYAPADQLRPLADKFRLIYRTAGYPVSRLTLSFLDPLAREHTLSEAWLVQVERGQGD